MLKKNVIYIVCFLIISVMLAGCGKSAGKYYKDGMKYFQKGSYQEAAKALSESIKKNPEKAEYYIAYGMSLIKLDQNKKAIVQFDKAIMKKDNQIVRENNKKALRGKGIAYFESHQYDRSIESFDKALSIHELEDLDLDILLYKADAQNKVGNYEEAVESYSEIIKNQKNKAANYAKRALMLSFLGKKEEALKDYDKAIQLEKSNYDFYFGKYFLYLQSKDEKSAKAVLEEALQIKEKTEEDSLSVGKIYFYQKDYNKAKSKFLELSKKEYGEAYYYLGCIAQIEKDYQTAIKDYEVYIKTDSGKWSAEAFYQLGSCYLKQEDYENAFNKTQEGLKINDRKWNQLLQYNEILSLEHLAQFEEAASKAKDYIEAYPQDESMLREYDFIKSRVSKNKKSKE